MIGCLDHRNQFGLLTALFSLATVMNCIAKLDIIYALTLIDRQ